jgi:4-amino-4-deoxy-L-arabinose transferase-like glycosyltransferase
VTQPVADKQKVRGFEVGWLIMLTSAACLLRWAHLNQSSLSHFDEGVYVLWGVVGDYPSKEFFAPPLFPMLIRALSTVMGATDLGPQMLSGLFGSATVPAVWWISRRWFGPTAAIASASMAAFSGFHIAFSRLVLTDATFTFWFVLAIALVVESLPNFSSIGATPNDAVGNARIGKWCWLITAAAGLSASAAMNTKYNGFLVLVIPTAALLLGSLLRWNQRSIQWDRTRPRLVVIAGLAGLLYVPWFWHVQSTYGYGAVLAHHRGYSTGLGQWPQNFLTLLASQHFLDRGTGFIGPIVGLLSAFAFAGAPLNARSAALVAIVGTAGFAVGEGLGWIFGLLGLLIGFRSKNPASLVYWVWIASLVLLTPLYRPYARLMLPLLAGGWIAYGALVNFLLAQFIAEGRSPGIKFGWAAGWLACLAGAGVTYWVHARPAGASSGMWSITLRSACEQLARAIPEPERVVNYVRPPALYYIFNFAGARAGGPGNPSDVDAFRRWLGDRSGPRFLVLDLALLPDNLPLRDEIAVAHDRLTEVARFPYRPSDVVLLDDFGRACLSPDLQPRIDHTYQLVLYRKRMSD